MPPERLAEHASVGELALDGRVRPVRGALRGRGGSPAGRVRPDPLRARVRGRGRARRRRGRPRPAPRRGGRVPARRAAAAAGRPAGGAGRAGPARPRGRARPGAGAAGARARGGRPSQPAARRAAGNRQDDARPPAPVDPAAARAARAARGHAHPLGRRAAVARSGRSSRGRPSARRTTARRWPRSSAAGPGPRPGEASLAHRGVLLLDELPEFQRPALEALRQPLEDGSIAIARVAGFAVFPARFQLVATMNLCPCAGRGDPGGRVLVLAAAAGGLSRQALAGAARPLRPRRHRAASASGGARAGRAEASAAVRGNACVAAASGWTQLDAAAHGARPTSSSNGRSSGCRCRREGGRGWRASRERPRRSPARTTVEAEHVAEALAYRAPKELRGMSELALASFAAVPDAHLVGEPRSARFAALPGGASTSRPSVARLAGARAAVRWAGRTPRFPPLLRAIHDPPPGLFLRGAAEPELLARPAVAIVGARACSPYGRQVARTAGARAGGGRARGRAAAWRAASTPRRTAVRSRQAATTRRRARLRHRPRLPGGASRAGRARSRHRASSSPSTRPGVEPAPWRFPARNRIVAGLCAATVVVEARERSGALITRDFALEEGTRGVRRTRRDHELALGGLERVAAARRDAVDARRGRARELRPRGACHARSAVLGDVAARRARHGSGRPPPAPTSSRARRACSAEQAGRGA